MAAKLAPNGVAGIVLANGSLSSQHSGEGEIRKRMVEDDLVECIVALPPQLFYNTQIPACLWILNRNKSGTGSRSTRDRRGEVLFIDARNLGSMVDRTHRELTVGDIGRIASTLHAWRGNPGTSSYADVPGFCSSATLGMVAKHMFVLTPGRYVGAADAEEDNEPIDQKVTRLRQDLLDAFDVSDRLQEKVRQGLRALDG
jgi:type I restriction enzyme M protein